MRKGNNIRVRSDGRYEARYIKERDENGHIIYGYCYGKSFEEAERKRNNIVTETKKIKGMNLLILGAGTHGEEVYELAKTLRTFDNISFLDDFVQNDNVIGKWIEAKEKLNDYPIAIVAVGAASVRAEWQDKLADMGFIIPKLIHPTAIISVKSSIGAGSVICANAIVDVGARIGRGCIVSAGATVGRDAELADWEFLDNGESVLKKSRIDKGD